MGCIERLIIEEEEKKGYVMIEIRPEGHIDRPGSDITLNRRDMQSKFGLLCYTTLTSGQLALIKKKIYIISKKENGK